MSVPARKKSTSSVRRRRSHHTVKALNVSPCEQCKEPVRPHHACANCGIYKGRQALDTRSASEQIVKKATETKKDESNETPTA